jgi:hypothetical protein
MKWTVAIALALALFAPSLKAQTSDHIEVGAFVDYFNLSRTSPNINYVGIGGRAGFNVHPNVQIEGEMAYDFERNFTTTFSNGATTQFVRVHTRPLPALLGPKFQTNRGPFRAFATFKVGFVNFSTSNEGVLAGFQGSLGAVTSGDTSAAIYPGVGVEGFWGHSDYVSMLATIFTSTVAHRTT